MRILLILLSIFSVICVYGCASSKVYVDTDEVPGLGAVVHFPSGKIIPIEVKRVISGNIIELTNKEKVVFIGVKIPDLYNTPQAARRLNEELVMKNQIRLEFDKKQRDSRGRLLAYAYTVDGVFINAEIIRKGLAKAISTPPNLKNKELLLQSEAEARKKGLGIWSKELKD